MMHYLGIAITQRTHLIIRCMEMFIVMIIIICGGGSFCIAVYVWAIQYILKPNEIYSKPIAARSSTYLYIRYIR